MSNDKAITSAVSGKMFTTSVGNCKSKVLIYGARCLLCNKQYVGKTTNMLQTRISRHHSHVNDFMNKDTDDAVLPDHLKQLN